MIDASLSIEEPYERILEVNSTACRCINGCWLPNCVVSEVRVHIHAIAGEISHRVVDSKAYKAGIGEVLLCNIIRKFALVKMNLTMISIPLDKVSEMVFREETV